MEHSKTRIAQVAGKFYPSSAQDIREQIKAFLNNETPQKSDVIACLLPHAGYVYSGSVATQTVSQINLRSKIVLLGPNHTGFGAPFSIMTEGTWQTPLGEIKIDLALAKKILHNSKYLKEDSLAHRYEHSLEVELPILQYFKHDFEIIPIAFSSDNAGALKEIGREIADTIIGLGIRDSAMIIASSDMTHYEPQEQAEAKDKEAIEAILELDEDLLMKKINKFNITMCGWAPAIVMIKAAKTLGAKKAKLIKYGTSGDVSGDKDSVVGYAGITIY